ncbi:thermonuclease family protein [Candidatus Pelagibacter sp.]|uniref:thermonuclease family protein n=1 Tax=Candidatus Pelagibacter sp. TaxID=2024849 RepID=UPI003F832C8A
MLRQKITKNIANIILGSLLFIFLVQSYSYSHSGRTNTEGCHKDNKKNNYHCHSTKKNNNTKKNFSNFKIIDGDTIHFGKIKYRFSGIDAPEKKQTCLFEDKILFCGILATKALKEKISNSKITCIDEGVDRYNRIIGECFINNNESLSSFMVKNGYAFAYRKYSIKFIKEEEFAKKNSLGLWKMKFEYPWDYRKNN